MLHIRLLNRQFERGEIFISNQTKRDNFVRKSFNKTRLITIPMKFSTWITENVKTMLNVKYGTFDQCICVFYESSVTFAVHNFI